MNDEAKFSLGQLTATRGVADKMTSDSDFCSFVWSSLGKYISCDWGDLVKEDRYLNDEAIKENDGRIMGVYKHGDTTIWIITEADRSYTTVLFPYEY